MFVLFRVVGSVVVSFLCSMVLMEVICVDGVCMWIICVMLLFFNCIGNRLVVYFCISVCLLFFISLVLMVV